MIGLLIEGSSTSELCALLSIDLDDMLMVELDDKLMVELDDMFMVELDDMFMVELDDMFIVVRRDMASAEDCFCDALCASYAVAKAAASSSLSALLRESEENDSVSHLAALWSILPSPKSLSVLLELSADSYRRWISR